MRSAENIYRFGVLWMLQCIDYVFGCRPGCAAAVRSTIPLKLSSDTVNSASKQQAQVKPCCTVEPSNSEDVADVVNIARQYHCTFAVLGGGTSPSEGTSNAEHGITIVLRRLRTVNLRHPGTEASHLVVGGGALWADVYKALDPWSMSATGTRNSLTGIAGSILGGGISFFSEMHGWACDCVIDFEAEMANGTIVTADCEHNPDLFWALKGGGTNFAIVTRVTLEIFSGPPTWYSFQRYAARDADVVFAKLEMSAAKQLPTDIWQIAVTYQWHVLTGEFVISERQVASEHPVLPKTLHRHDFINNTRESVVEVLQTVSYQRSILEMAQKMDDMNPYGFYNLFGTITVHSDALLFLEFADIFRAEVEPIKDAEELQVYIVYNPVTLRAMRQMKKRGGNALGLAIDDGPLTVVNINLHWSEAQDMDRMRSFMRGLIYEFTQAAARAQKLHPYLFLNHAFDEQEPFAHRVDEGIRRLMKVRQVVDPEGVFQVLQTGPFKLLGNKVTKQQLVRDEL